MARRVAALLATLVLVVAACGGNLAPTPIPPPTARPSGEPSRSPSAAVSPSASSSPAASASAGASGLASPSSSSEATARIVFERVSRAVVFVRTPTGAGSGFAIDPVHIVTNAHVVRPFLEATITLADGTAIAGAKVVDWDLVGDLTVLQLPRAVAFEPVAVGDPSTLERGDRVYLVGYPMADLEAPTSTITEGIVAATPFEWRDDLTFHATDAAIDDGQSGGVMADGEGRLLGVTGGSRGPLAIALDIDDALRRVAGLLQGVDVDGLPARLPPTGAAGAPHDGRATIRNRADTHVWVVSGRQDQPSGRLTLTADQPAVLTALAAGGQLANSGGAAAKRQTVAMDFGPPGPYLVKVDTIGAKPATIQLAGDLGLTPLADPDDGREIAVGQRYEGASDYAGDLDWSTIRLRQGQRIVIRASGSGFDPALFIDQVATDKTVGAGQDSGGPLGMDDELRFQTPTTGDYRIVVSDARFMGFGGYRLEVFGP